VKFFQNWIEFYKNWRNEMATRKNKRYYKFHKRENNTCKDGFLENLVFEHQDLVLMTHVPGDDPVVHFISGVDEEEECYDVSMFDIDCLPLGVQRITKAEFDKMVG